MDKEKIKSFIENWERIASDQDDEQVAKGMRSVLADLYQELNAQKPHKADEEL